MLVATNNVKEFVAVDHPAFATNIGALKHQALMFNRIAIPSLSAFLSPKNDEMREVAANLHWLLESGVVFEPTLIRNAQIQTVEYKTFFDLFLDHSKDILETALGMSLDDFERIGGVEEKQLALQKVLQHLPQRFGQSNSDTEVLIEHLRMMATHLTRILSIQLREVNGLDAFAMLPAEFPSVERQGNTAKQDVIQIVLAALPVPDRKTSWDHILEFRSDRDSQNKFLDLRNRISDVARGQLMPEEAEEKLEYLLSQYQRQIKIHRMKADTIALETICVSAADIPKNLLTLQWGKIAKGLFSIRHRKITLLEGELTARGSEVAYIIKARNQFS